MLLLLTGSSGAGKSTVRRLIARELAPDTECVELGHVVSFPPIPTIAWRQRSIAACLLDVGPDAPAARLARRGDDPHLLADHIAFADWMRGHAKDPRHMPHVLSINGWQAMRWERLGKPDPGNGGWAVHVIDTSELSIDEVAEQVLTWCRRALEDQAPAMRVL